MKVLLKNAKTNIKLMYMYIYQYVEKEQYIGFPTLSLKWCWSPFDMSCYIVFIIVLFLLLLFDVMLFTYSFLSNFF